eukprot:TRINITY_DN15979_c0_g1_i1.p1 TRINITY_DN15979_c0_g1~~TRINITY_DN15979_c0_g1_i1.p1  ORF type:complete len:165 (-),score=30.94 TRINITY_DN15979_c0_g1_i1:32-526(-)
MHHGDTSRPSNSWERFIHTLRYYTGYPKKPINAAVIEYESDNQFIDVLQQGKPVVVVMCLQGAKACNNFMRPFQQASERYGKFVQFVSVDCDRHTDFCFSRGPTYFPTIELFNSTYEEQMKQSIGQGPVATFSVDVLRMKDYDHSLFGLRSFLADNQAIPPFVK